MMRRWKFLRGERPIPHGRRASYREGALFGGLTFGAVAFLALLSAVLNSRIYGVAVIGEYALAMSTVAIVRLLSTTKERPALVRELTALAPRDPRVTGLFLATLVFSFGLTLIVGVGALLVTHLLLSGPISQPNSFLPIAVNVAGYVFVGNTGENFDVVFNGFRAARQTFSVRAWTAVSFIVISVPLGLVVGSVWGLIVGNIGSFATSLVHRLFLVRPYMRLSASRKVIRDGFRTLPGLIRFGMQITPGALADGASNSSGTWIVASFNSIDMVGAYGRAWTLVGQLTLLSTRTNEMLFPTLIERRANRDGAGYARALVDSLRYTSIVLLLPAVAFAGVAQGVMRVFGPGFEQGASALAILLLSPSLVALTQIQRQALYSLDRPVLGSISGVLRLIVTIGGGLLLTWKLGATGAALALVLGLLADLAFATQIVVRHLETPFRKLWPVHQWLAALAASGGGYGAARALDAALPYPLGIFIGSAAGAAIFIAILLLSGGVNERDWERYRDLRRSMANRRLRAASRA
jgi:O-antigen/teichoic acid export membrane protein